MPRALSRWSASSSCVQLDRTVAGARHQRLAVGAEGQRVDEIGVSGEPDELLARCRVPQAYYAIARPRGQASAVGAESHTIDIVRVHLQGEEFSARVRLPDPHGF